MKQFIITMTPGFTILTSIFLILTMTGILFTISSETVVTKYYIVSWSASSADGTHMDGQTTVWVNDNFINKLQLEKWIMEKSPDIIDSTLVIMNIINLTKEQYDIWISGSDTPTQPIDVKPVL